MKKSTTLNKIEIDRGAWNLRAMFNSNVSLYHLMQNCYVRLNEIRLPFFNKDLSPLSEYSVMINVHADGPLGTYLIHNSYVDRFIQTDDFDVYFTVAEYIEARKTETWVEQIDLLKVDVNDPKWGKHNYKRNYHTAEQLGKKTLWRVVEETDTSKCIGLIGKYDSMRFDYFDSGFGNLEKYKKISVRSLEEGLDYLINFGK